MPDVLQSSNYTKTVAVGKKLWMIFNLQNSTTTYLLRYLKQSQSTVVNDDLRVVETPSCSHYNLIVVIYDHRSFIRTAKGKIL